MVWLIVTTEQLFPATVQITLANDGAICLITASEGEEEKKVSRMPKLHRSTRAALDW